MSSGQVHVSFYTDILIVDNNVQSSVGYNFLDALIHFMAHIRTINHIFITPLKDDHTRMSTGIL